MKRLAGKYKGKDVVLIGMHDSTTWPKELAVFAKKQGMSYILGIDRTAAGQKGFGKTANLYGIEGIPTLVVIDQQGRVALRSYDLKEAELLVDRLLKN